MSTEKTKTRWSELGRDVLGGLSVLKVAAEEMLEHSPIRVEEVRELIRRPRTFGAWLELKSPRLGRHFMGVASNLTEPFTLGMGFRVERLAEDAIEVLLPGGWRNQGEDGAIHSAALCALGETTVRLFWEAHLDLQDIEMRSRRVQARKLGEAVGEVRGVFRLPEADREAILHELRAEPTCDVESQTLVYDRDGRLVAEIDVDWHLRRRLRLQAGSSDASGRVPS